MVMKLPVVAALLCVSAMAYDDDIKPCWDIRLAPDTFCFKTVKYSVSTGVFYGAKDRDIEAKRQYQVLRDKWEAGGKGSPSNHCLGIAKDFYCFQNFPRCHNDDL